jgi:seryl-tRNA synthetase
VITSPDEDASWKAHESMIRVSEEFYDSLGLHYQGAPLYRQRCGLTNTRLMAEYGQRTALPTAPRWHASAEYRRLVSRLNPPDGVASELLALRLLWSSGTFSQRRK